MHSLKLALGDQVAHRGCIERTCRSMHTCRQPLACVQVVLKALLERKLPAADCTRADACAALQYAFTGRHTLLRTLLWAFRCCRRHFWSAGCRRVCRPVTAVAPHLPAKPAASPAAHPACTQSHKRLVMYRTPPIRESIAAASAPFSSKLHSRSSTLAAYPAMEIQWIMGSQPCRE